MAESYLLDKLKSVEQTFDQFTRQLADPDTAANPAEFQKVAKARASLEETVIAFTSWKEMQEELSGAQEILKEAANDAEMREMASLEVQELEDKIVALEERLNGGS